MKNKEIFEQIKGAASLAEGLKKHFSFLAGTPGFEPVLAAVMDAAVDVQLDNRKLLVLFPKGWTLICKEPAQDYLYKDYPQSFRAVMLMHDGFTFIDNKGGIRLAREAFNYTILKDGKDAGLLTGNRDPKENIRCCFTDFSDWWIYHPEEENPQDEAVLCLISHESCDIAERRQYNIGSLLLTRMAEILELNAAIPQIAAVIKKGLDDDEIRQWFNALHPLWRDIVQEKLKRENLPFAESNIAKLFKQTDSLFLENYKELDTLSGIEKFTNLRDVVMSSLPIEDFSPLATLSKLEELRAGDHPGKSYQWLRALKNLKKLVLFSLSPECDIKAIGALSALTSLSLYGQTLNDISFVSALEKLEKIDVEHASITSLEALRDLKNLTTVDCGKTQVSDLSPLHGKSILFLNCSETAVTFENLLAFVESLSDDHYVSLAVFCDYTTPKNLLKSVQALKPGETPYPRGLAKIAEMVFDEHTDDFEELPELKTQLIGLLKERLPKENFNWLAEEADMTIPDVKPKTETKLVEKSAEWSEIEANMDEISAALKDAINTFYLEETFTKYKIFDTADRIKVLNAIMENPPFPSKNIDDEYQTTKDVFLAIAWKNIGTGME